MVLSFLVNVAQNHRLVVELWLPFAWPCWTWYCCMVCRGKCPCHRLVIMIANHQLLQQARACGRTNDFALCCEYGIMLYPVSMYLLKSWTALCPAGDHAASNFLLSFAKRKGLTFGLRDAFCNFAGFLHDLAKMRKKWTSLCHPGVTLIACLKMSENDPNRLVSEDKDKAKHPQQSGGANLNKHRSWESQNLGFHNVPLFPFNTSQINCETCEGATAQAWLLTPMFSAR